MKIINKILLFSAITISAMTLISTEILAGEDLLFEKTLAATPGQMLTLDAFAGNVNITTGSTNEVSVKIYGNEDAKEKLDFTAESSSEGVTIEAKKRSNGGISNLNLKFEIQVPAEYNLNLKTGGGNLSVGAIKGTVVLTTSGGNINLECVSGAIKVSTQGGNITLKSFDGNVSAETNGGNVKMAGTNGSVYAATNGGNISLDYSGKNYGIELTTNAGNVKVDIPSEFDADVDMSTTCGRISTDIGTPSDKHIGSSLKTTIGNGGNKLMCSTNAGTISAYKK